MDIDTYAQLMIDAAIEADGVEPSDAEIVTMDRVRGVEGKRVGLIRLTNYGAYEPIDNDMRDVAYHVVTVQGDGPAAHRWSNWRDLEGGLTIERKRAIDGAACEQAWRVLDAIRDGAPVSA